MCDSTSVILAEHSMADTSCPKDIEFLCLSLSGTRVITPCVMVSISCHPWLYEWGGMTVMSQSEIKCSHEFRLFLVN